MIFLCNRPPINGKRRILQATGRKLRGVTLIELIITVAIAGILAAVAAPSFRTMMRKNRVDGMTNQLAASLNLARSEAVKRGKRLTVCKTADPAASNPVCSNSSSVAWQSGWLVFVDESTQGTVDGADIRLQVNQPAESAVAIDGATNYAHYISYLPTGLSNVNGGVANGTFTICMEGVQRRIVISTIGRINITQEESC